MRSALLLASLVAISCGAAEAGNDLYIVAGDNIHNLATLTVAGDGNSLSVRQDYSGPGSANSISIELIGDLNGGPLYSNFSPEVVQVGLKPGHITQTGFGNTVDMTVRGFTNLFAIYQNGASNTLTASVTGNYNQAAVAQYGTGNSLAFTQNGFGNVLSVIQRSQ